MHGKPPNEVTIPESWDNVQAAQQISTPLFDIMKKIYVADDNNTTAEGKESNKN